LPQARPPATCWQPLDAGENLARERTVPAAGHFVPAEETMQPVEPRGEELHLVLVVPRKFLTRGL